MTRNDFFHQTKHYRKIVIGSMIPIALMILLVQMLSAQQSVTAANIEVIKNVDRLEAQHGDTVQYTINMSNTGDAAVATALMTDTVPADLTVISSSVSVQGGYDSWGVDGNVITWTGAIAGNGGEIDISFDAVVSDTAAYEPIINTVYVTGTGSLLSHEAVFTVTDLITYYLYMPVMFKAPPAPTMLSVSPPTSSDGYDTFQMTANWSNVGISGQYELQESQTPDFVNSTVYDAGSLTSGTVTHNISRHYEYYYRVRFVMGNGQSSDWSNVIKQYGPYNDRFDDPSSGWFIRREDLDDVENYSYYENGNFVLKIKGRWDFAIGSPMKVIPWNSYRIETRIRFDPSVDNLHSYGLIWGGDWDGTACPNAGFTSCLNHYYRLNLLWYGNSDKLRMNVKRIDYHDKDGQGRGVGLADWENQYVGSPSGDWKIWTVENRGDGKIDIYVNGELAKSVNDSNYAGAGAYFGILATSNEYLGTEPWVDWVRVTPIYP